MTVATDSRKLYVFDLDGTLVDAFEAIVASTAHVLDTMGYPVPPAPEIIRAVGWGNDGLLGKFIRPDGMARARALYREHHASFLPGSAKLMPGARELLESAAESGLLLAVATNRGRLSTDLLLETLDIARFFSLVVCAEEVARPKPAPDILLAVLDRLGVQPERALYFGDMTVDAECGREAGVDTVIVTTGTSTREEIEQCSPALVLDSLSGFTS